MRLFKFLVIHNNIINNTKIFMPVIRTRKELTDGNYKTRRIITTKNILYLYRHDISNKASALECLDIIDTSDKAIALMSVDYPNEDENFAKENKAYVIIDTSDCEEVMKLISPIEGSNSGRFSAYGIKDCNDCIELSKTCRNKNVSIHVPYNKREVRGKTWSFVNDKAGTKLKIEIGKRVWYYEPKTGGIAHSSIQWKGEARPETFKGKTIAVPLHHWIKCHSIPNKPIKKGDYSFYHIGHTFDYRKEFIGIATKGEQESLRKEIEPKNNIHRGRRVLARQQYFSRTLECDCGLSESNPKCRDCEGVLYIDTEQGLVDLYNQLMSDEYGQLREGKTI